MKRSLGACLAIFLGSCRAVTNDGTPIITDGSLTGFIAEATNPGSTFKAREAADENRCLRYGFKPGTDAYSNCRLQLDQAREINDSRGTSRAEMSGGLSLLCKDAIARRDSGAVSVHC